MKIKILPHERQDRPYLFRVLNAETGEELEGVHAVTLTLRVGHLPSAQLEVRGVQSEGIEAEVRESQPEEDVLAPAQVVKLERGDILALTHPGILSAAQIERLSQSVTEVLRAHNVEGVKVIVLEEGMRFSVLRPESAEGRS